MDIGKILRERAKFPAYRIEPKKQKDENWGIYPNVKVDQAIFFEDDEFKCLVSLFSYSEDELLKMQDDVIREAQEGMKKNGWEFWLHAANHKIQKIGKLYRSEINFIFKVKGFEEIKEEVE